MAYKRGKSHLKRACFGLLLIEQGILHLRRATCGSWVMKRGIIHFQRDCFGIWFIKRGKFRGTQREYSSKPHKHSIVERTLSTV